jgi:hypothetical protein
VEEIPDIEGPAATTTSRELAIIIAIIKMASTDLFIPLPATIAQISAYLTSDKDTFAPFNKDSLPAFRRRLLFLGDP